MRFVFAYPGDLETLTGGYGYDRRMIREWREAEHEVTLVPLGEGFPFPSDEGLVKAETALSALPDGTVVLVDGLAFGVMDAWAKREAHRLRIFALCHHPLALEGGQPAEVTDRLRLSETEALAQTRGVVVTSPATARALVEGFGVSASDILTALPGTDPAPLARFEGRPRLILSIGSLTRRKGHDVLIAALARLSDLHWRAQIVGAELDADYAAELRRAVAAANLEDRVTLSGEVADTRALLEQAEVFALASRFEGYGMVFAEALSQGVPVVACAAGAVPDVVPPDAGILVPPDDPEAFAEALRRMLTDPALHDAMAEGARRAGEALPSWRDGAAAVAAFVGARA